MAQTRDEPAGDNSFLETVEYMRQIFDSSPLAISVRNETLQVVGCNAAALELFGFKTIKEFCDHSRAVSVPIQPDGRKSEEASDSYMKSAIKYGQVVTTWYCQNIHEDVIPAEITVKKIDFKDSFKLVTFIRDLREELAAKEAARAADEINTMVLNACPLACMVWEDYNKLINCNEATLKLFGLRSIHEFTQLFDSLSPEYQPDGSKSQDVIFATNQKAIEAGPPHDSIIDLMILPDIEETQGEQPSGIPATWRPASAET